LEAKHVQTLGMRFPLYLFMLDLADWETGKIKYYRDQDAADKFQLPLRKMRDWRRRLEDDLYISSLQKGNHQEITINKWQDPREKEPVNPIVNDTEGYEKPVPLSYEKPSPLPKVDTEGYIKGGLKTVTLPYIKDTRSKTKDKNSPQKKLDDEFKALHQTIFSGSFNKSWWDVMENAPKELDGTILKIIVSDQKMIDNVNARTDRTQWTIPSCGFQFTSFELVYGDIGNH